jgi:hypothetical protein
MSYDYHTATEDRSRATVSYSDGEVIEYVRRPPRPVWPALCAVGTLAVFNLVDVFFGTSISVAFTGLVVLVTFAALIIGD